jgi:hypothetical protein
MRSPSEISARVIWSCVAVAAASVVLAITISGIYANAIVSAGDALGRQECGTTWEPNAVTSECADALEERSWTTVALLGVALFGTLGAVLVAGRWPRGIRRPVIALAAVITVLVIIGGLIWSGVIDRTVGA